MPTKPQNSSREMVLPAYKAAISPGPPTSHTTPSNSANPRSAKQITHPTNQIRDTSLPATSFGGTRDAKQDIRATSLPATPLVRRRRIWRPTSDEQQNTSYDMRDTIYGRRATHMPSTFVENPLQIRPFMQNKPNFLMANMNANLVPTKSYENETAKRCRENKPKQTQFAGCPNERNFFLNKGL